MTTCGCSGTPMYLITIVPNLLKQPVGLVKHYLKMTYSRLVNNWEQIEQTHPKIPFCFYHTQQRYVLHNYQERNTIQLFGKLSCYQDAVMTTMFKSKFFIDWDAP